MSSPSTRKLRDPARRLLLLFPLAILFLGAAGAVLRLSGREVSYTETVLAGDRGEAAGLVVEYALSTGSAGEDTYALWEITHTPASGSAAHARFSFVTLPQHGPQEGREADFSWPHPLQLTSRLDAGNIRTDALYGEDEAATGLTLAARRLPYPSGGTVRLADYYDCYPISGALLLDGGETHWNGDPVYADQWSELTRLLSGYIRVPVLEDHLVALYRLNRNTFPQHNLLVGEPHEGGDSYTLSSRSALGEDAVYFSIGNRTEEGELVDTSRIPGGYGLYRLSYTRDGAGDIRWGDISTVYPLREEAAVVALRLAEDGSRLLLVTEEGGGLTLTVVDTETWTQVQTLPLAEIFPGPYDRAYDYREFLFLRDGHLALEFEPGRLALYTPGEAGLWLLRFVTPPLTEAVPEVSCAPFVRYSSRLAATAWDGERLAVVTQNYLLADELPAYAEYDYPYTTGCGFQVAVYDGSGLRYLGRYDSSLDPGWPSPTLHGASSFRLGWS